MKKIFAAMLAVIMVFTLAACGADTPPAETPENGPDVATEAPAGEGEGTEEAAGTPEVTLKLAHSLAETLPLHQAFMEFSETVKERTNGAVQIDVYANGQLGAERDIVEGMQLGTVDFGYIATAVFANFVPDYYLFDAPFLFEDTESILAVCDSEIGENLGKQLEETQGLIQIGFMDVGGRNIFSTKPVETIEDFEGLKIRVMENDLHIALFNMLGAQATPMAFTELYTALQQGTVDAGENALQGITGSGFDDICKYITISNHIYGINVFAMGQQAYNKIPEEYRDIVMEEAWNCVLRERELVAAANESALSEMEANGCTVYTLDHEALVEKISPIYDQFADILPGELIQQVQEFLANR